MKLIKTSKYKGFTTEFYLTPKVDKFLRGKKVDVGKEFDIKDKNWYEAILFELLDDGSEKWSVEKEKRKSFRVVFNGIVEKWLGVGEYKGFEEKFDKKNLEEINNGFVRLNVNGEPFCDVKCGIFLVK